MHFCNEQVFYPKSKKKKNFGADPSCCLRKTHS